MWNRDSPAPQQGSATQRDEPRPAIEIADLTVRYGSVLALDDVSLTLQPGRICGLIGMNGSGKSTLFKSIMGLVRPSSGRVSIAGHSPNHARTRGLVSYVPQAEDVDWDFPISVREVAMTGRYGRQNRFRRITARDRDAVDDALARVGLTDLADRQIGKLSGGQRKRAFVARGIAQEAEILLLDEPFAGVDKRSERTIIDLLVDLSADGATILISTHDLSTLPSFATEAVLLMQRVLVHGTPADALRPENLALAFGVDVLGDGRAEGQEPQRDRRPSPENGAA
ncbi:metal ABC transporter ATP-binding protein [Gordonia insulae]|uniref:Putative siderophore transport system ATP-binding protein YusV n=1 Tax=Gordonia insulae TaxID=2420509 RepID=A0A3G8JND2_9ACTN|nr:metal ABC transporter ATP-binding protein [Gordonia insulae]AZG46448.1 putative siderophore transport system ATP-binding protein YusV [Gordonia insulae]